jgi:hypothetical protein
LGWTWRKIRDLLAGTADTQTQKVKKWQKNQAFKSIQFLQIATIVLYLPRWHLSGSII